MLGRFGKDASSLLGVEIASDSIRIAQLRRHRGRYKQLVWAVEPFAAGNGRHDPDQIVTALRSAYRQSGCRERRAAVALPASQVICKLCQLPVSQAPSQMEAQLLAEADRLFPFPLEDLVLDFQVLGASLLHPGSMDVLVAASRQSALQPVQAAFEAAGLELEVAEVDSIALRRLMPKQAKGPAALLRIEPGSSTLHGWLEDTLPLRREWLPGAVPDLPGDVFAEGAGPEEVLVVGAAATGQGLIDRLSERFGMPCRPLPPVAGVDCSDGCMALAFALAMGSVR
ncbi:type IV pilus biogenesis protein PilM [Pseudomonas sp. CC120222-01a]|uniref:type IV pilus biogenesis protein PilM n=1 Tax=Pseudomonas sp. CC120222-01a TaxID=1378075 RepID=UPI000D9E051F|nr:pilus assembly protein PilM [Pseudomonas sp. CC120222-01a]PVZ43054.1 type IV pilus assembly protein PilM [Pseudomonas sp. CC120222-01a]